MGAVGAPVFPAMEEFGGAGPAAPGIGEGGAPVGDGITNPGLAEVVAVAVIAGEPTEAIGELSEETPVCSCSCPEMEVAMKGMRGPDAPVPMEEAGGGGS